MQIYGFHPVHEALRQRSRVVQRVLIVAGRRGKRRQQIEALCRRSGVPFVEVRESDLDPQSRGVHNGFVAEIESREPERCREGGDPDFLVVLEDIQDPRNLGAIIRVCDGAGVGRVLIRDRGTSRLTPTVTKASAGATEWAELERITNTANEIARLKKEGFWIYGADAAGRPPWEIDLTGKVAFCLGGEESGLRRRTRSLCDELVGLPMRGGVDSLNVSAAAAALLYEALRQRS
ncbi:MAG: 23S rRNA (guanosine(2251)-2'-O)-methyltransferase RlmB [Acidobacteriota bacterium]